MSTHTIERDIQIEAPIDIVWRTVTEPEQIRTWFSEGVEFELRPGAIGKLTFGKDTDDPHVVDITIVAAERPHRFSFRWCYPPGEHATADNSTLVTFMLSADGDARTSLRVVETGLDQLAWPEDEKRKFVDDHQHGWQVQGAKLRDLFVAGHASSP